MAAALPFIIGALAILAPAVMTAKRGQKAGLVTIICLIGFWWGYWAALSLNALVSAGPQSAEFKFAFHDGLHMIGINLSVLTAIPALLSHIAGIIYSNITRKDVK